MLDIKDLISVSTTCDVVEFRRLLREAYDVRKANFLDEIYFYPPGMVYYSTSFHKAENPYRFHATSVTGKGCYLNCDHCGGKLLETMIPVRTPEDLYRVCEKVKAGKGCGCLVSGGCLKDGTVPLQKHIPMIKRVKEELGLEVVVHRGLLDEDVVRELANAKVDGVMLDIIGWLPVPVGLVSLATLVACSYLGYRFIPPFFFP